MIKEIIEKLKIYIESEKDIIWYRRQYVQILILLFVIIFGIVLIKTSAQKNNATVEELENKHVPVALTPEDDENPNISEDDIEVLTTPINTEDMVTISMEDTGRADPFLPTAEYEAMSNLPYYMIPPPKSAGEDEDAVNVVKTKVSGIMYDRYNPSAILNIDGSDYLVRSGQLINNYRVLAITPSMVTVQLGANTYRAGVGEMFSGDDWNAIDDSFGAARRR